MPYTALDPLAQCLAMGLPAVVAADLTRVAGELAAAGARPFEVVAGTPTAGYGARLTFACGPAPVSEALGLAPHPWGPPTWLGLRASASARPRVKGYHRRPGPGVPALPAGLPADLEPVMASLDGLSTEAYLRLPGAMPWSAFVEACLSPLGLDTPPSAFPLVPRPSPGAFGVAVRWDEGRLAAITVYSRARALPPDETIREAWSATLDETDRAAYELALAGVRAFGPRPTEGWHSLLSHTFEAGGARHRAVSLRVPRDPCC